MAKKRKSKQDPTSRMLKRMGRIEEMVEDIKKSEEASARVDKKIADTEEEIQKTSKKILGEEREIGKLGETILGKEKDIRKAEGDIIKEEEEIKEALVKIATFTFRREHALELTRGVIGAGIGVGIGFGILNIPKLASELAWQNAIGILIFVLGVCTILIYKNGEEWVEKEGMGFVAKRLATLYAVCICIEAVGLILFGFFPTDILMFIKILIIGSYLAMVVSVAFMIAK